MVKHPHLSVGDRTSGFVRRHLSYLLSRLLKFSRDETPDGSTLKGMISAHFRAE